MASGGPGTGEASLSVFTVPVAAGFPAIEQAMAEYRAAVPAGEWYYVNVYARPTTPHR